MVLVALDGLFGRMFLHVHLSEDVVEEARKGVGVAANSCKTKKNYFSTKAWRKGTSYKVSSPYTTALSY